MAETADVEELSLYGLLSRLDIAEKYKGFARPNEAEQAVLESEAAAKKRVAEVLGELAGSALTSFEKKGAGTFLEAQIKAIEPGAKNADARRAKLEELLKAVRSAGNAEEPGHVRKAKAEIAKVEKDFAAVHMEYEKWEKGKKMLSVDELNKLKRSHEDLQRRLEAAKAFLEEQLCRRADAAAATPSVLTAPRPAAATAASSGAAARGKASAPGAVKGGGPAARKAPSAGYPSAPSSAAVRQAQAVAQIRAEAFELPEPKAHPPSGPPSRPRPQPVRPLEEAPKPVLSYSCTCAAVAEVLGINEKKATDLADSSAEFAGHLSVEQWEQVQKRSVEIEKERREQQREAEKRKQDKALAKISGAPASVPAAVAVGRSAAPKGASSGVAAKAPPGGFMTVVAKAKPKAVAARQAGLGGLAHSNRFAGMGGDSDGEEGDGWTTRKK